MPVSPAEDPPGLRFTFDISLAVRPGNEGLRRELDAVLRKRGPEIHRLLVQYGVPLVS